MYLYKFYIILFYIKLYYIIHWYKFFINTYNVFENKYTYFDIYKHIHIAIVHILHYYNDSIINSLLTV